MTIEILVPDLPESVADATVATWHKKPGDMVARDEVIVEIETDKVVLEVQHLMQVFWKLFWNKKVRQCFLNNCWHV